MIRGDIVDDMDLSDALFSPSKARQQQAQAKDWIFVDSWLSRKYHPKPVPAFERNEETLQSLMTLVAFNERADEERALVERVERQALKELQEQVGDDVFFVRSRPWNRGAPESRSHVKDVTYSPHPRNRIRDVEI